jgi:hypothetical protein
VARKVLLALLKMRIPYDVALAMPEHDALQFLEAWKDMHSDPKRSRKYLVKK